MQVPRVLGFKGYSFFKNRATIKVLLSKILTPFKETVQSKLRWDKSSTCKRAYGLGTQCRPNECLFRVRKPRGVGISGREGARWQDGEMQGSVYKQPKGEVDGSHRSKEGSK
jgi:hypothetical protein